MPDADNSLTLAILKEIRAEMRDHRTLILQIVDALKKQDRRFIEIERRYGETERRFGEMERRFGDLEHRFGDLSGEMELMLKSEIMGSLTHFETQIDEKLALLADRVGALETAR